MNSLTSLGPVEQVRVSASDCTNLYSYLQRVLPSRGELGSRSSSRPLAEWPGPASPAEGSLGTKTEPYQLPPDAPYPIWVLVLFPNCASNGYPKGI